MPVVEPITLTAIAGLGMLARRIKRNRADSQRRRARRDRGADRVLPASWDQVSQIETMAHEAAGKTDRDADHVLLEYGAYTYAAGRSRTMIRKRLTRREAADIIARMREREHVTGNPDRKAWRERANENDPLTPREDEEDF